MTDNLINQAAIDAYNASLDFAKYPDTGLAPFDITRSKGASIPDTTLTPKKYNTVQAFDSAGQPQAPGASGSSSGSSTVLSPDMVAMKQKGFLQEKGFFGDQSMTNENTAFNNVVGIAAAVTGLARTVASTNKPLTASRQKYNNYFLYDNEKEALRNKAIQIASIGIIPYDVIEEFLYILVTIDNLADMYYISTVVGIPELNDRNIIREPILILGIPALYKVGYLANGVASVNMQYGTKFNNLAVADHTSHPLNTLLGAAAAKGSIGQFPTINIAMSLVQDIIQQVALTTAITQLPTFSGPTFNSLSPALKQIQMASLSNIAGQSLNLNSMVNSTNSILRGSNVLTLSPVTVQLEKLNRQTRDMSNFTTQLSSVNTIAATAGKCGDIGGQMGKITSMSTNIASLAGDILSLVKNIAGPGNIGPGANIILQKTGGFMSSGTLAKLAIGQGLPPSVMCKNPMMTPPSFSGKAFFGEGAASHGAMDQVFCKRIGAFPKNECGSANMSFGLQNHGSFGGETSLTSMVSRALLGVNIPPVVGILADIVVAKTLNLSNLLNVPTTSAISSRRSDHSIPYMTAMGAVLIDDTKSPFPIDDHANGWKLAASTGNEVQRYNPQYLSVCSSSL